MRAAFVAVLCIALLQFHVCTAGTQSHTKVDGVASGRSWAGANFYLLWATNSTFQNTTLDLFKASNIKVVRIFLTQSYKPNYPVDPMYSLVRDVEYPMPGDWQDEILERVDSLAYAAYQRGIKLTVALHDRVTLHGPNAMGGIEDAYFKAFNVTPAPYSSTQDCSRFYCNSAAQTAFKRRLRYILNHVHPKFNKPWAQLPELFFSFEAENEPQLACTKGPTLRSWLCDMSTTMMSLLRPSSGASGTLRPLITTGGGGCGYFCEVDPEPYANCSAIDVLAIHDYTAAWLLKSRVGEFGYIAKKFNKRWIVQEFGCRNADPQKRISTCSQQIGAASTDSTPWMLWSLEPHSTKNFSGLNLWPSDPAWKGALLPNTAAAAKCHNSTQSWPEIWGS